MAASWEHITVDNVPMKTYLAVPSGEGPFPGVVVAQHASGVDTFIQTVCDRLAQAGYAAAAPDLYHRQTGMTFEELGRMRRDDPKRWPAMKVVFPKTIFASGAWPKAPVKRMPGGAMMPPYGPAFAASSSVYSSFVSPSDSQ